MIVVGVDGCKGGWVAAVWNLETNKLTLRKHDRFEDVVEEYLEDVCAIGVDIPIGLMPCYRACDAQARRAIRPRSSCVFDAPPNSAMKATNFRSAVDEAQEGCGKKFSIQAYCLLPKMIEVNSVMSIDLQERVIEIHPEVSFWAMNGSPMLKQKSTLLGYEERQLVLAAATGCNIWSRDELRALMREERKKENMKTVQPDDVLDAIAGAWTARRWSEGKHGSFPTVPERNQDGLRAEIIF